MMENRPERNCKKWSDTCDFRTFICFGPEIHAFYPVFSGGEPGEPPERMVKIMDIAVT